MKKLDEIMELMTDEMADFKTSILKLQLLSKQLGDLSIPISTEALEKNLNSFLEKQQAEEQVKIDILKAIDKKLKDAQLMPRYILVIFGILGILTLGILGYSIVNTKEQEKEKLELSRPMVESENSLYEIYFAENPELRKAYSKWLAGEK